MVLRACKGYGKRMHWEGVMVTLENIFAEIEDDVEMLKGVTSKDDVGTFQS